MEERWLDVVGFEGRYQVSDWGRVKSVIRSAKADYKDLILSPAKGRYGHLTVILRGVKNKTGHVHRLVLEAFIGPCPPGMECRHFPDRNPGNNRLENLRWGTRQENMDDKRIHGTIRGHKIDAVGRASIAAGHRGLKYSKEHREAIAAGLKRYQERRRAALCC